MSTSISEHARQEELLPCPFCGGAPEFDENDGRLSLTCMNPACEFDMWFRLAMTRDEITKWWNTRAIDSATAAKEREIAEGMREAKRLAEIIWRTEYKSEAPDWSPLDTVGGIISQIDNMFAGIRQQRDALQARVRELEGKLEFSEKEIQYYINYSQQDEP